MRSTSQVIFTVGRDRKPLDYNAWPSWALELSVPMLDLVLPATIEDALTQVDGLRSTVNPERLAEGVAWHERNGRTFVELDGRANFKVISNRYLVEHGA